MKIAVASTFDRLARFAPAFCGLVTAVVFLPALAGGFLLWDDNINLLDNQRLWQAEGVFRWMFTDIESVQRYKPLNWLLWWALGEGFGLKPVVFHAANLVLHAGNTVLLFYVLRNFLQPDGRPTPRPPGPVLWGATVGTLGWALHPLRVEPVAWISGAGYPLCTGFALLTVLAFQHSLHTQRPGWQWIALVCFGLSLLSYPAAASLPALLLILLVIAALRQPGDQTGRIKQALWRLIPYGLLAAVLLGLTLLTRLTTNGEFWSAPADWQSAGLLTRGAQAVAVWTWYLEKSILPLHLSPIYGEFRDFSPAGFRCLASVATFGLVSLLAWRWRQCWPEAGLLWVAYLLLAVPVLGVTDIPFSPADRYTYVPALALALLVASAVARGATSASAARRRAACLIPAGLLLGMVVVTGWQLRLWRSPVTFFHHAQAAVAPHPTGADLHWRLGLHYLMMDEPAAAREEFRRTLELHPQHDGAAHYVRQLGKAPGAKK